MKIVSFIDEDEVIRKILKHCSLWMVAEHGRGKDPVARAPPAAMPSVDTLSGQTYDTDFFSTLVG